jgi:hypothetical protein
MHGQQRNYSTTEPVGGDGAERAGRSNGSRRLAAWGRHHRLMREVNERIRELAERNGARVRLLCECGDLSCAEALEISAAEYARIRTDGSRFLVFPGHERPKSERIVVRTGGYVVVADRGLEDGQPHRNEGRGDG